MEQERSPLLLWSAVFAGVVLAALTVSGTLSLRWGIWPFLTGISVTVVGAIWLSLLVFFQDTDAKIFLNGFKYMALAGLGGVMAGLCLLSGIYLRTLLFKGMEMRWIIFWPLILIAVIVFWVGVYRKIIRINVNTFHTWERFFGRKDTEPRALLKRLVKDVILQEPLREESKLRWFRHILIFWGFVLLWFSDITFALLLDYLPILGFPQFSQLPHIKTVFKFLFESFGLMILLGTSIALIRGFLVRGTNQKIYSDSPTALFLFLVVSTGYIVEGARFASIPYNPSMEYSFLGNFFASLIRGRNLPYDSLHQGLWLFHVILACSFIAYFPMKRLIHSCATPLGKLMQSQKVLLEKKVTGVVSGLLQDKE
jgi:nitrate reductase gamma subunit